MVSHNLDFLTSNLLLQPQVWAF